jgi:formylmethanofuran dehydrogenase subunit C
MKSGTIFVKGKVLEMLPSYKDEGTEEVDGVTYRKYTGDLSRNGGCAVRECVKAHSRGFFFLWGCYMW